MKYKHSLLNKGRSPFANSSGFTLVGVLTASTIGVIVVLGLIQLSVNIVNTLNSSKRESALITLIEEIKHSFQKKLSIPCDSNEDDCFNACSSSLVGYKVDAEAFVTIREPSVIGLGNAAYKGGQVWKGIKIEEITFKPQSADKARVVVQFGLSDDTRETLMMPKPLNFEVLIDEMRSDRIRKCTIDGAFI